MIKTGNYDLVPIYRGCDWGPTTLIWKDKNGNPIDLSSFTPYAQTVNGVNLNPVIVDAVNGVTTLSLTKAQTVNLRLGTFDWDWLWWQTQPSGTKWPPFLYGKLCILEPKSHNLPAITPA